MIKKYNNFINEDLYVRTKRTQKQIDGFIQQTAEDYDMKFHEVERIYKKNYDLSILKMLFGIVNF